MKNSNNLALKIHQGVMVVMIGAIIIEPAVLASIHKSNSRLTDKSIKTAMVITSKDVFAEGSSDGLRVKIHTLTCDVDGNCKHPDPIANEHVSSSDRGGVVGIKLSEAMERMR